METEEEWAVAKNIRIKFGLGRNPLMRLTRLGIVRSKKTGTGKSAVVYCIEDIRKFLKDRDNPFEKYKR